MEAKLQGNIIYRPVGAVEQGHGIVQPALQDILMQSHAGVLEHKTVKIIGIVVQFLTDLRIGKMACSMIVNVLDYLTYHIIIDITQLLMPNQIDHQIFELNGVLFTEEYLFNLKFLDNLADFRLKKLNILVKEWLV